MRPRGFTLIEVLIALAIVAFGLSALFTTVNTTVRTSDYLREKTLGGWIALNKLTEARLAPQPPATDKEQTGTVEYAGNTWRWEVKAFKTTVDGIVRLEARAAPESAPKESWPGFATGFIGNAVGPARTRSPFGAAQPVTPDTGGKVDTPQPDPQQGQPREQTQEPPAQPQENNSLIIGSGR